MLKLFFEELLVIYPSLASFLGDRKSDSKVEVAISPVFIRKWTQILEKYQILLDSYIPKSQYDALDCKTLAYLIKINTEALQFNFHLVPLSSFSNPILEFTFMEKTVYPNNHQNMILRHKCYIKFIQQAIINMKQGIKQRYVIPKRICKQAITDIETFIDSKGYICNKAISQFLESKYRPHLKHMLDFLKNEYYDNCTESIACKDLPNGMLMYTYLLKSNATLDISPEYVHKLGIKEVARIKSEFIKLASKKFKYKGDSLVGFMKSVQDDPKNYFQTKEQVVQAYIQARERIRKTLMPKLFYDQVTTYEIHPVPKILESSSAGAFFYPGNMKRPGRFFINLRDVKENPKYTVETLAIHEGEPGHHYQYQYMLENNVPFYRIFANDGTAFAEGWALYTESLSMSNDKFDNFGRLTYEMFRAVRCVVDTGIHVFGWTFEQALDYMKLHLAMKESELITELERYICIPGQAIAYKIGEQFLLQQREKFLKRKNNNIKDFHKRVLDNGVLPLCILEDVIKTHSHQM